MANFSATCHLTSSGRRNYVFFYGVSPSNPLAIEAAASVGRSHGGGGQGARSHEQWREDRWMVKGWQGAKNRERREDYDQWLDDSPSQSGWEDVNELGWSDHRGGPSSSPRLGMTDEGKGLRRGGKQRRYPGRLPPVVSSLFSIKAAHWSDGIRGTELGARGKERTARGTALSVISSRMCRRHACRYRWSPRKRLRLTRRSSFELRHFTDHPAMTGVGIEANSERSFDFAQDDKKGRGRMARARGVIGSLLLVIGAELGARSKDSAAGDDAD